MILVTGGAGFIGGNFILDWLKTNPSASVINLDALTYAGNLANLETIQHLPNYQFVHGNIVDKELVSGLMQKHRPRAIVNFAAESHVDRSIHGPGEFIQTNINGTFNLLECARAYWSGLDEALKSSFRFLHVSTDEVYGSLGPKDPPFTEKNPYSESDEVYKADNQGDAAAIAGAAASGANVPAAAIPTSAPMLLASGTIFEPIISPIPVGVSAGISGLNLSCLAISLAMILSSDILV